MTTMKDNYRRHLESLDDVGLRAECTSRIRDGAAGAGGWRFDECYFFARESKRGHLWVEAAATVRAEHRQRAAHNAAAAEALKRGTP